MKKFYIIIALLVVIVIAAIIINKKSDTKTATTQDNKKSTEDNVQWILNNISEKNIIGLYKLYVWYRDNSNASNPYGSAKWDLYTNHKVGGDTSYDFTKEQSVAMDNRGVTLEDLIKAYEQVK